MAGGGRFGKGLLTINLKRRERGMIQLDRLLHKSLKKRIFPRHAEMDLAKEIISELVDVAAVRSWKHDTLNPCNCKGCIVKRAKEFLKGRS